MIFAPFPKCSQTILFSLAFVLYMSMRIRSESITHDEFAEERSHDNDSDYGSLPFATTQELVVAEAWEQPADTELPTTKELV